MKSIYRERNSIEAKKPSKPHRPPGFFAGGFQVRSLYLALEKNLEAYQGRQEGPEDMKEREIPSHPVHLEDLPYKDSKRTALTGPDLETVEPAEAEEIEIADTIRPVKDLAYSGGSELERCYPRRFK